MTSPSTGPQSPADEARRILDANTYLIIATADSGGRPWATPVWFAARDWLEFYWVSRPEARHSQNIAATPDVGIVIFDSTAAVGDAAALYLDAVAEEVGAAERDAGLAVYAQRSTAQGLRVWGEADVVAPAQHRLYRARTSQAYVLDDRDHRVPVT